MKRSDLPSDLLAAVQRGIVIPAHPLALNEQRRLDTRRQRALTRYYLEAGVGGIAVGVHTTQFAIRDPGIGLLEPVLTLTSETINHWVANRHQTVLMIAGICGKTEQAAREAGLALERGYHAGLLSLAALAEASLDELIDHCREIAAGIPIIGFYLQPAVGGRTLPYAFWRRFVEIENVLAIKIAPFNRYQTLDVVRAVQDGGREGSIALYTGNDDHILLDLISGYPFSEEPRRTPLRIVGGLLGQWAVGTRRAVELLETVHHLFDEGGAIPPDLLATANALTEMNAAVFDAAHQFRGCVPGIHEVLRRQGLLAGNGCLDPEEVLSPGQAAEIDRVCRCYPELQDDDFVRDHLESWLEES